MNETFDLRTARLNRGLTQRELARVCEVNRETVRRLESGIGATPRNAKKIADHFGVRVTDLMPLTEPEAA